MIKNALFIFGVCAAVFIFFLPSYLQMQEFHGRNSSYARQIKELSQENESLLEEKRRLEEDPNYLERYARERFGIIKDGEVVYKIVPAGTAGAVEVSAVPVTTNTTAAVKVAPKAATVSTVKKSTATATKKTTSASTAVKKKSTAATKSK